MPLRPIYKATGVPSIYEFDTQKGPRFRTMVWDGMRRRYIYGGTHLSLADAVAARDVLRADPSDTRDRKAAKSPKGAERRQAKVEVRAAAVSALPRPVAKPVPRTNEEEVGDYLAHWKTVRARQRVKPTVRETAKPPGS